MIHSLFIEIIRRTPPWVFLLFTLLLLIGWRQSKDRTVSRGRVAILPVAMIGLSLYGVLSAFSIGRPAAWLGWGGGICLAGLLSIPFPAPAGVAYSPKDRSYSVPGSWIPLLLLMVIFFIKYAVGVTLARHLPIAGEQVFIASVSLCYGLISGLFLVRALTIWRAPASTNGGSDPRPPGTADAAGQ